MMRRRTILPFLVSCAGLLLSASALQIGCASGGAAGGDPYAAFVWPPPPDKPRIKLEEIYHGRDVETRSTLKRVLLGAHPEVFDYLEKPHGIDFDMKGRILVTDTTLGAVFRFDRKGRRLDVLGTRGEHRLKAPLGLGVAKDGRIAVADGTLKNVLVLDPEGAFRAAVGKTGELENPTDAAFSPDGSKLYVADSKAHRIVVFDPTNGKLLSSFGRRGEREGEFNFPTALSFGPEGDLFVVDQANARIQVLSPEGEFLDQFGGRSVAYGAFIRPKDVAVDEAGLVYVTDAAFNNVQIFNSDLDLLTFMGEGGDGPGRFQIPSGVAVRGNELAVVDQLNRRIQIFRYVAPKAGDLSSFSPGWGSVPRGFPQTAFSEPFRFPGLALGRLIETGTSLSEE